MPEKIPTRIEKCKGAMLATAIGDALGWPNEPCSKNRVKKPKVMDNFVGWVRCSNNPRWHDEKILPGEYSDDTQLTLAVARSIIAGDWETFLAEKELPFWLKYERGGGGALLKAAKSCEKGILLWKSKYNRDYYNAGGNGAVMRILPHVIASAKTSNTTKLIEDVIKDTLITHGHPRAFLGAACYAYALEYLLKKENILEYGELIAAVIDGQNVWGGFPNLDFFKEWLIYAYKNIEYDFFIEWENVRTRMVNQFKFLETSLKRGLILDDTKVLIELGCFSKANGAGDVAILAAIYFASRYANNPSLGIKIAAFSFGSDTDTIASITGGLLGMLNGMDWIPIEWRGVQDYSCLVQMTELLMAEDKKQATKKEVEKGEAQDNQWNATPIGKIRFIDSCNVPNGKNGIVIINKWQTTLGQTIYTKVFQPNNIPIQQPYQSKRMVSKSQQVVTNGAKNFVLNLMDISELLGNPEFKMNITIGKVLKIIEDLVNGKETSARIAKKHKVEQLFVEQIEKYVIDMKNHSEL